MNRILLTAFLAVLIQVGKTQAVSVDLFLSNARFEDLQGNVIDANSISYNQVVKIKVNIGNLSLSDYAPAGHYRIKIGLGSGTVINPGFEITTAPLSNYFAWSLDLTGAQPQIVGNGVANFPANTVGTAEFELKAITAGTSTVSYNLLIANPTGTTTPLSDPLPNNNVASNDYTVAGPLSLSVSSQNVGCYGSNDGSITATAIGGIAPFTYTVINTTTNQPSTNGTGLFTGLSPATYNISVTDAGGNTASGTTTISQPAEVILAVTSTNVSCFGDANGTITASASAGATLTVNGAAYQAGTLYAPGTYLVVALSPNGNNNGVCTKDVTVIITQPNAVTLSATATNVSCYGLADGTITATASPGAAMTVNGSPYNATAVYGPGTYTVTASAPNGNGTGVCTAQTVLTITQPADIVLSVSKTNVTCNRSANGTILVMAPGATVTVNGSAYNPAAQYGPGAYTVVATATGGNTGQTCTKQVVVTVTEPPLVTVSATHTNVTCNGLANGTITVTASAGAGYVIRKDGVGPDLSGQATFGLGVYLITASAPNGNADGVCTSSTSVTITEPPLLTVSLVSKVNNTCHGGTNGEIKVQAAGGTAGYAYTLAGPTVNTTGATSGIFTGLAAGTYSVTATDANGCTAVVSNVVLSEPTATAPDVILSVADYTDNFFPANNTEVILLYQLSEIAGNPAFNDVIRITKQTGYSFSLPPLSTLTVGSGANAVTYTLDNSRWTASNSSPSFFEATLNSGQQLGCGQSVYVAVKLTRTTPNRSVFTVTSVARNVTGEVQTSNNSTTIVLVGQ